MKKGFAILMVLCLCVSLAACGQSVQGGGQQTEEYSQDIVQEVVPDAVTEAVVPNEDELTATRYDLEDGTIYTEYTDKNGNIYRTTSESPDGSSMEDTYYPGNFPAVAVHINREADGSYHESHYANNGYWEGDMFVTGTITYMKNISADDIGTEFISEYDEEGNLLSEIHNEADGSYRELRYENGTCVLDIEKEPGGYYSESRYNEKGKMTYTRMDDPATGKYYEQEHFENGKLKRLVEIDPAINKHYESDTYENGKTKYIISKSVDGTLERRYDEVGFTTYYYEKAGLNEIECIADEAGKLVKYIENGKVSEDAKTLSDRAKAYGFRE